MRDCGFRPRCGLDRSGFDPKEWALYYARVIEILTTRWIVYDAFCFGLEIPKDAKKIHQERAYTAPIWYTP